MKNHFKCLLSLFLVVIMLVPMISATGLTVSAATYSGTCGDNLTWSFDSATGVLKIEGTGDMTNYLTESYNSSYRTTAPWKTYISYIKSVVISDSVTSIGSCAFYDCTSLTSVTIPDSVTSVGEFAFYNCSSLKSVTIGNSVTSIGDSAFDYCTSLTSVTIGNSVTSIGEYAFYKCTSLTSVTIGNSVTRIDSGAFQNCDSLTSVTIPDSVTSIGYAAFASCDSLTSVTIPDSVTSIGDAAFASCDSLTSVTVDANNKYYASFDGVLYNKDLTDLIQYPIGNSRSTFIIPDSVTSIGDAAFTSCDSLTSVTIPDSVTSIGDGAFAYCDSLTSVTIGNSVTSIGDSAFDYCTSLISVTIPDSVTSIGDKAFYSCTSLTSVTIPDSVTSMGKWAFADCDSLTSVTIGNSVTSIGEYAFYYCTSLISVTIGNSVTSIGDWAFYECTSLISVTIPDSVTSIGDKAFHYYSDGSYNKLDLTIKCYENSYAHTYAVNNGFKYELMHKCVFTNYVSDNNASCTTDGTKTAYCDLGCGATDIIPVEGTALSHTWSEWIVSIEPTYTTEGKQIRFCYVCDIVENKIIPAVTNPEEDVLDRFEDVNKNAWYADAVRYCVTMGYAQGMNATTFAPNATLTRAQFVQLLAGIDGVDLTQYNETDSTFKDVKVGAWFHNAITWTVSNEYVAGMSSDSFKPNDNLTRQQLVRILYNYAADNGVDVTGRADLTVYDDCDKIAEWAYEELSWAVYNKIVSGMTETTVGPRGTATRAQAMQIIKQFDALASK